MDMWVRAPICKDPAERVGEAEERRPPRRRGSGRAGGVPGSLVTMKVYNAISLPGSPVHGPTPDPTGSSPSPQPPK
jgi:hypothetical protein